MGFTKDSIARSMLYSWIEFDGNMYLQQNSVTGARQLLEFAKNLTGEEQVNGIALNHWRTAENRTCIAYAAKAFIRGPIAPEQVYAEYAAVYGIEDIDLYSEIMQELDDLDTLAREKLFNIGFCVNGCWIRPGLRWTENWENDAIEICRNRFDALIPKLIGCLQTAAKPAAREILRFLINRIGCSILQLECAREMKGLAAFCDHDEPERLSDQQKRMVHEACDRAMVLAQSYIRLHAEGIIDRGCEGTLISYRTTLPNYIEHIRAVFAGGEKMCTHLLPQLDEPPPPRIN
jgi:hypothetical protein